MVKFRDLATGKILNIDGTANHRAVVATMLNLFNDGEPREDMGWRLRPDLYCVRLLSRTTRLPMKVSAEDIRQAREISKLAIPIPVTSHKLLATVGIELRPRGFGLMRKMPSGWRATWPQGGPGNAYSARAFFCRYLEHEIEHVIEADAYMPGARGKALEHQKKIAEAAGLAPPSAPTSAVLTLEQHLAEAVRLLDGAPYADQVAGARIQILPTVKVGYVEPNPDLVLSRVFKVDLLRDVIESAARRERPIVYYEVISNFVGALDPQSHYYTATVMQAFSRAFVTAANELKRDRIFMEPSETRMVPLPDGNTSKQVLFRRRT